MLQVTTADEQHSRIEDVRVDPRLGAAEVLQEIELRAAAVVERDKLSVLQFQRAGRPAPRRLYGNFLSRNFLTKPFD
jgi:hypothetical protein